jgi:hypothetical protein
MVSRVSVATLLAASLVSAASAQTGQAVNPNRVPPGSRAPAVGSTGSQSGGVVGDSQLAPGGPAVNTPGTGTAMTPPGQADIAPGRPPATGAATESGQVTEEQARRQLASAGYTDIRELQREPSGGWRGRATRDGQMVGVAIDSQGRVVPSQ